MDTLIPFISGIIMTASATSMTGGVHAEAGQTVQTGNAYSSVLIENTINTSDSGGSSYTVITTSANGTEHTEVRNEKIPASGSVSVQIATSSHTKGGMVTSSAHLDIQTLATTSLASSTGAVRPTFAARITSNISWLFKNLFSWWGFGR